MKEIYFTGKLWKIFGRLRMAALLLAVLTGGIRTASAQEKLFTYDFQNKTVKEILSAIEPSGYAFLYSKDLEASLSKTIDLKVNSATIDQLLTQVFRSTDLTYKIVDRQVLVSRRVPAPATAPPAIPAAVRVQGKVVDDDGVPVAGATVALKAHASIGTKTDINGQFTMMIPDTGTALTVSYIGKEAKEVALVAGKPWYDIVLSTVDSQIEEVVVSTGYFNRRKDNFTGSAVVVSGEELRKVNPNNLLQSIQAFDPSFRVATDNMSGSNPNQPPKINVRGAASVPTGAGGDEVLRRDNLSSDINLPTFILDGFEVGIDKVYDLDINRVASISLLKDAAATAIYGSRAANGVLVITTIAPREGELRLMINYELTASFPDLSSYDVLNAAEKLEYERLAGLYEVENMPVQPQREIYYNKLYNVVSGVDTYWLSQPVQRALGNKLSLFLEGGSSLVRYGITGIYQTSPGVMKGSGRDRLGLGVDLAYNANSRLMFKNVLTVANVTGKDSPFGSFSEYVRMNPYYPKTDAAGQIVQNVDTWADRSGPGSSIVETYTLNPLFNSTLASFYKTNYWEFNDAFSMEWNITSELRLRGLVSFLHKMEERDFWTSPFANYYYNDTGKKLMERGEYKYQNINTTNVDANTTLTYSKATGDHFFNGAIGANIRTANLTGKAFTAIGFSSDHFSNIGFARGYKEGESPQSIADKERLFGAFFSLNYSFRNRYLFDASLRADGSSKFGADNKIAPFWATGIGWNVHNEEFMSRSIFSQLRLKATTGLTGSVSFTPFMAQTLYQYNKQNWYITGQGAEVKQYGNTNLKWQRARNYDLGADVGILNDRFFVNGRYYYKLTMDMLADVTLAPSTGFGYYKENLGEMKNEGYEFGFKAHVVREKDFTVSLNGNFVHNRNVMVKISNALKKMNDSADEAQTETENLGVPLVRYEEGRSLNTIYAVRSRGIDPENGKEIFVKKDGTLTHDWSVDDIVPICDATPKLEGFFGGSVSWKGFLLTVSFYTRFGGYEYNQTLVDRIENADPRYNLDSRALAHRWKEPGDHALYKDVKNHGTTQVSDRFIQRDNLLEFSSLYLSYDFNAPWVQKWGMKQLRLSLTANNLWQTSSIHIERGIDYPFARSCTFTLQTTF